VQTLNVRLPQEVKDKLIEIADKDNRSITKEIIQLIEKRFEIITRCDVIDRTKGRT